MLNREHILRTLKRQLLRGPIHLNYTPEPEPVKSAKSVPPQFDFLFVYDATAGEHDLVQKMGDALKIEATRWRIVKAPATEGDLIQARVIVDLGGCVTQSSRSAVLIQTLSPEQLAKNPAEKRAVWSQLQAALRQLKA